MSSIRPIVHIVQRTARYQTPIAYRMPKVAWITFTALHKVHQCWRWYRKAEIYTNNQNFQKLLTGHVINWVVGDKLMVRIAAQCVLIVTRILACVEQQIALHRAYHEWIHAIKGTYLHHHYQWKMYDSVSLLSPSTANWLNEHLQVTIIRIKRIVCCSLRLIGELFKLSMCLMDAIEAFSCNPSTRNESINEIFVNTGYCIDQLVENKEFLLETLSRNKPLVQTILRGIGTTYQVEQLIETVSKAMNTVENVQKVSKFSGPKAKKFGKQMIHGFLNGFGFRKKASLNPGF